MRHQEHLVTWPEVIYDRHGISDVAGRPLTYRRLRCMDCDWTGTTRTYAEAVELRTEHELFFTLAANMLSSGVTGVARVRLAESSWRVVTKPSAAS